MGTSIDQVAAVVSRFPKLEAAWFLKECPSHQKYLPDYYIARFPLTNEVWREYVRLAAVAQPATWGQSTPEPDHPVFGITYEEVEAFGEWVSETTGRVCRPPTEAQWEKAARGTDGREWPWGDEFDPEMCNTRGGRYGGTTPVDRFLGGASPFGAVDMAGNVEEWTSDFYEPYPGGETIRDDFGGPGEYRVTRGGWWSGGADLARCARRHGFGGDSLIGGRLALVVDEEAAKG